MRENNHKRIEAYSLLAYLTEAFISCLTEISNSLGDSEGYAHIKDLEQGINAQINQINSFIDLIGEIKDKVRSDELTIETTHKKMKNLDETELCKKKIEDGIRALSEKIGQTETPAEQLRFVEKLTKKAVAYLDELLDSTKEIDKIPDEILALSQEFANEKIIFEEKLKYDIDLDDHSSVLEDADYSNIEQQLRDEIGHQQKIGSWASKAKKEADKLVEGIEGSESQKGLIKHLRELSGIDFQKFNIPTFKTKNFTTFQSTPSSENLEKSLSDLRTTLKQIEFRWNDRARYPSLVEIIENCKEDVGKAAELIQLADEAKWKEKFGQKWKELRDFYNKLENGQSIEEYLKDSASLDALKNLSDEEYINIIVSKE